MIEQVANTIKEHHLIPCHSAVVVAVSGGADSVCLLHVLKTISETIETFGLVVAHLDHSLRSSSAQDADFVATLCRQWGIPYVGTRLDVAALARDAGIGLEEAGRDARRCFLQHVASGHGGAVVALAHHLDDQAETVLMRAARGCGVSGLAAMRWKNDPFIRPLLGVGRQEIEQYLLTRQIAWVDDESNRELRFQRNRIRHRVLPQLQIFNTQAASHLAELAERVALEESYWQAVLQNWFETHVKHDAGGVYLPIAELQACHPALRDRLLRDGLRSVRGDLRAIEASHVQMIADGLSLARPQWQLDLPRAWVARRYEWLVFRQAAPFCLEPVCFVVDGPGSYRLTDGCTLLVEERTSASAETPWQVEFDADRLSFPLSVRPFVAGDRLAVSGMTGRKKVKELFVEQRWSHERRRCAVVVEAAGQPVWVPGLRRSCQYPVNAETQRILRLKLSPEKNKI